MRRRRGDDPKDREPPTFYGPIHHGGSFDMVHHNDTTRREFAASMEEQIASLPPKDAPVVTVIVPVYNEARTIGELLRRVDASPYSKQITVVDDGSNDETSHVLDSFKGENRVEVLRHPANRGKGAAIRTALEHACAPFTIIQDADLEYDPQDYPLLVEPLRSGEAQAVFGSRYYSPGHRRGRALSMHRLGISTLNIAVRLLYGARLTDEATCYKAFRTELLRALDLHCQRFEFCPEVTAKVCRLGLRILEVPIRYEGAVFNRARRSDGAMEPSRWPRFGVGANGTRQPPPSPRRRARTGPEMGASDGVVGRIGKPYQELVD